MIQKKVCMLGAFAVGKSSLVARFVNSIYSEAYHTTVGVKVDKKEIAVGGTALSLVLWDIQGEDALQKVKLIYLRGAAGYLLVVDGTRANTLDVALSLQQKVTATLGPLPFVLLLNKADRTDEWELSPSSIEPLIHRGWKVTQSSARTGTGVDDAFLLLGRQLIGKPDV